MQPPQQRGPARSTREIAYVHRVPDSGEPRRQQRVQSRQVAGVHDRGTKTSAEAIEFAAQTPDADTRTMERDYVHARVG